MIRIVAQKQFMAGVTFFRAYQPLIQLSQHPDYKVTMFDANVMEDALSDEHDIYFASSASYDGQLEVIKLLKEHGRKVVVDYDDSEYCDPSNQMYAITGTEEVRVDFSDGRYIEWIDGKTQVSIFGNIITFDIARNKMNQEIQRNIKREASALVTTTNHLRSELLQYNPNVYVIPNIIDPVLYTPKPNDNPEEVRVGWAISSSHLDDIVSIKPELLRCLQENPKMKLVIMCFGLSDEFADLPQDRVEIHPGVNINKGYHKMFSELQLDIGICHLEDNAFNWKKSPVKWAEYSAMGIPTVASHVMYSDHVTDRTNAYIYKTAKEFRHAIKYLIDRPELRKTIGAQAQEDAYAMFGIPAVMPKYDQMFKLIGGLNDEKNINTNSTNDTDIN